jgi:hypothetical protein
MPRRNIEEGGPSEQDTGTDTRVEEINQQQGERTFIDPNKGPSNPTPNPGNGRQIRHTR